MALPDGAERLREAVRGATPEVDRLLDQLLGNVLLVRGGLEDALAALEHAPDATVVTLDGDRLSPSGWRVGAARSGATNAALEAARAQLEAATTRHEDAISALESRKLDHDAALSAQTAAQLELAPLPTRLAQLEQALAEHLSAVEVLESERDGRAARARRAAGSGRSGRGIPRSSRGGTWRRRR